MKEQKYAVMEALFYWDASWSFVEQLKPIEAKIFLQLMGLATKEQSWDVPGCFYARSLSSFGVSPRAAKSALKGLHSKRVIDVLFEEKTDLVLRIHLIQLHQVSRTRFRQTKIPL